MGAGIVGLSTARALRDHGVEVTLYERHAPGGGQSAGETRIFRLNHPDPRLVPLAQEARRVWSEWEDDHGARLVSTDGVLVAGPTAAARLDALRQAGEDAYWVDASEQRLRLPFLQPQPRGVFVDPRGGAIRTREAIGALESRLRGAIRQAEVLAVHPVPGGGVAVFTPQGSYRHNAAVLCAGQETVPLARQVGLVLPVERSLHLRATFRVRGDAPDRASCLQDSSMAYGESVYGSPFPSHGLFAVGLSGGEGELDMTAGRPPLERFALFRERLTKYVSAALPGLEPKPVDDMTCWVTRLPWGSDGVAAWKTDEVTAIAGHNLFKLAPVLGRLLAEAVCEGEIPELLLPERQLGRQAESTDVPTS